jgi:integrase
MPRQTNGLAAKSIERATPGFHADGGGLYLRVGPTGGKAWVFRYMRHGRRRDMGLGAIQFVGLAEARRLASECRHLLFQGIDPLDRKHGERSAARVDAAKAMTFRECAEAYIAAHEAGWRNRRQAAQWRASLRDYVYLVIGDLPVAAVDLPLVLKVLEPIWTAKVETASRVRGRIESVIGWAATRGYRQGDNPARWKGHLENLLAKPGRVKKAERHPALPYPEIGAFSTELAKQELIAARALEFTILTAARAGEVIGARWDEINIAERLWTVPPERMKSGKEHRIPLSDAAMAIVGRMQAIRTGDYIFPGRGGNSRIGHSTMREQLLRLGRRDLTVHGFRSTFRDWAAERTNYPAEMAEMALAHSVGSAVEQAYRRSDLFDRRRRLMDDWARYCAAPASGAAEVIAIRAT